MPQNDLQDQPPGVAPSTTEVPSVTGADGVAPPLGDMSTDEFRRFGHNLVD